MSKPFFDYAELDKAINAPKLIKKASVETKLEKLGFGLVRFVDDANKLNLWQVVQSEDGTEYIEALYDNVEDTIKTAWTVEVDSFNKSATIFYNKTPIKNVVFAELGLDPSESMNFKKHLPERLAANKELVKSMVNSLDESYKTRVLALYPELTQ
jgi:hypothetical protein